MVPLVAQPLVSGEVEESVIIGSRGCEAACMEQRRVQSSRRR
jgi:hypothetical protein